MLAYVFWHWPRPDIAADQYEDEIERFQRALAEAAVPGFRGSAVWRIYGAPWVPAGTGYEDWYLLENSGSLDTLNEAAVSGDMRVSHALVAALSAGGTAGLFDSRSDAEVKVAGSTVVWFSKPAGMSYSDFYARLAGDGITSAHLWRRRMVLGPTPEFCWSGDEPVSVLQWPGAVVVRRRLFWRFEGITATG